MTAHHADYGSTCPVCIALPGRPCRGVDHLVLPSVHGERVTSVPIFDDLAAAYEPMAGAR